MQASLELTRLVIGPTCSEWLLTYLSMIVFIWSPLSKRAIPLSPFILTLAMFLIPYHCWKGPDSRRESVRWYLCLGSLIWWLFVALIIVGVVQAPFVDTFPSFPFNCFLSIEVFTIAGNYGWNVQGCCNGNSMFSSAWVSFTTLANWTMNSSGHPLISTRIITLWVFTITCILFLQMCQADSRLFQKCLVTLKFSQGEEASSPWFGGPSAVLVLELQGNSMESSFSASLAALGVISVCPHLWTCLQVGCHCF